MFMVHVSCLAIHVHVSCSALIDEVCKIKNSYCNRYPVSFYERIQFLTSAFHDYQKTTLKKMDQSWVKPLSTLAVRDRSRDHYHRRFPVRVYALFIRSLRQNLRDVCVNLFRTFACFQNFSVALRRGH